ncbi:tRNA(m(1)G37)methyltransferase [Elasticomyces elasticus]|nr:tRNA(m(1)G37)methyltransferase [Elasticomyces elasticus]
MVGVVPYDLDLQYDYWTYHDIISAILPEDELGEVPSGFNLVGHVAHLNLRDAYLPYKHILGAVILDKNSGVRSVINKIDDVGEENAFRTFNYEVIAGEDDMNVEVKEGDCLFRFNYAKVYWNSKLNTEHERLRSLFKEGEAVCDVMAGIGPFAVPAGKKGVFVWANDLNPESFAGLQDAIKRNKVTEFVRPFNCDGHAFIRTATHSLLETEHSVTQIIRPQKRSRDPSAPPPPTRTTTQPKVFAHYVMNLPASALSFLPSFIGLYQPSTRDLLPPETPMPMVHVYCFSTKSDDNVREGWEICKKISEYLGYAMTPLVAADGGRQAGPEHEMALAEGEVQIWDVRDVAPNKRMFCASFRLPREVALQDVGRA